MHNVGKGEYYNYDVWYGEIENCEHVVFSSMLEAYTEIRKQPAEKDIFK